MENIQLDDKQLNKELAKKMINPYYFTDIYLKIGFKINLYSHHINHANSKLTIKPIYPEFGIGVGYSNEIMKEISVVYARLMNQYKFKYQTNFSARFDKQDENNQVLDETELLNNLNINHNITESDLDKINVRSPLVNQIQQQEMKDSAWRFDKINSLTVFFYRTSKMNVNKLCRISFDKFCFSKY